MKSEFLAKGELSIANDVEFGTATALEGGQSGGLPEVIINDGVVDIEEIIVLGPPL